MLYQWRYKVLRFFGVVKGWVVIESRLDDMVGTKPRPSGLMLYKPTKRKYDYFDYSGNELGENVELCETTKTLLKKGYIKFINKKVVWKSNPQLEKK
jgi:hypothetical protein